MQSSVPICVVCLWLLMLASVSVAAALVPNGGFESTTGWTMSGSGATVDKAVAHSGAASLKVENDGTIDVSAVSDWIAFPCKSPRRIIVRGWAKSDGLRPGGQGWKAMRLIVWARDEKGEGVKLPQSAHAGYIGEFGAFAAGTFGWKEFTGNLVLPAGVDSFRLTVGSSFATGRVWIDDISAVEVPLRWQPKEDPEAVFSMDMKHPAPKPVIGIGWNWEFVWGHAAELGATDAFIDQLLAYSEWDEQSFVRFGYKAEFNLKTNAPDWAASAPGLYKKVLAGLQHRGITVLACNWSYGREPKELKPPYPADEFAASVAETLRGWLVDDKFSCIKYASLWNEPCWSYSGKYPDDFMAYNKAFDAALRQSGIHEKVKLLATDTTESGYAAEVNFPRYDAILKNCADAYAAHDYGAAVEAPLPEQSRGYLEPFVAAYGRAATALGQKPLLMTEFGCGADEDQAAYHGLLGNSELVLGGLNAGIRAFARWAYNTPGGYCAFAIKDGVASPKPTYYGYSVLTKAIRPGSKVIPIKLTRGGLDSEGYKRVHCCVLSGPGDKLTVLIINDGLTSKKVSLRGLPARAFHHYYYDSTLPDGIQQSKPVKAGEATVTVPPGSINALVTWPWNALKPAGIAASAPNKAP